MVLVLDDGLPASVSFLVLFFFILALGEGSYLSIGPLGEQHIFYIYIF